MNWIGYLIVFQYTILLLQARPETSTSSSSSEKITLEMEHPASVSAIITTLENSVPAEFTGAELKKHLSAAVGIPEQPINRASPGPQIKKNDPTKKTTKTPELDTLSTIPSDMELISKTTRHVDDLNAKQKSFVTTTTPKADPVTVTTLNAEKPTIYDIITETEKNQTFFTSRAQPILSTVSPPLALPLSSQMPIQNQRSGESPKAIGHHVEMHHNGHPGIAEPLTWQQLESEMSMVDQSLKESSTSKDGISTWILLSGSDKQPQMLATPATTTIAHVEKVDVKDDRPNYRFGEIHNDKIIKPVKVRDSTENKKPKPEKKNKIPSTTTVAVKTTQAPPPTGAILLASDFMTAEKNRRKTPLANMNKLNKRKITTTTTTKQVPNHSNDKYDDTPTTIEETTTPVSFIVLEPKIAGFDLPQDRSPSTKKPHKNHHAPAKSKKKPAKKNKVASVTKQPLKIKEKPISTTIYNYLSREVMPSVGILGAGILLTAGLASYIFGPFGALRRSYDDASDRNDNVNNIYSVNSEEYANENGDNGQNEEEVFSKFLAGMPSRDVPRYVKYFKPDGSHANQPIGPNYPYRGQVRIQQQQQSQPQPQSQPQLQPQPQSSNIAPKYSPYMRYRMAPSPHYSPAQYNPQQQYQTFRNHQMSTQSAQQPQQVSPVYNPQYHELQKQKSFANNMDTILKHQTTIYGKSVSPNGNVVEEKSIGTQIQAEPEEETLPKAEGQIREVRENDANDEASAKIQRRTNTYVVGSSITDDQPGEAVVSASMTASVDGLPAQGIVEPVITVTASSHGPRRRRRDTESDTDKTSKDTLNKTTVQQSTTTTSTEAPVQSNRLYNAADYLSLAMEYNMLREKIMSFDRDYTNEEIEKKVEKKIQTEFKSISNDYEALKKAVEGAKAIEQFEKQVKLRAKNFELSVVLKTGISTLRQRIKYLNELVEHPDDLRIIEKINRRDGSASDLGSSSNSTSTPNAPELENGFVGFIKLLQLKAQFGLNLLQNIRPSFERAFEDVFKRPYEKEN